MIVRLLPAAGLALLILVTAPAMGRIRDLLFEMFPGGAVKGLAIVLGGLLVTSLVACALKIRRHVGLRWLGLIAVVILLALQITGFSHDNPRVDIVERIHILQYGSLALLLYWALRPCRDLRLLLIPVLAGALIGTLDETVQWLAPKRVGEIRDVAMNVVAAFTGLLFAVVIEPPRDFRWRLGKTGWRAVSWTAAAAVLTAGLFFDAAHLGYRIVDPEVGSFLSWRSEDELRAAAIDRAERWATKPADKEAVWGIADTFRTEAGWHVSHREGASHRELWAMAGRANQILERWYAPFLDFEDHRWEDWKIEKGNTIAAEQTNPSTYRSPVLEHRIIVWPKGPVRAAWGSIAALLAILPFILERRSKR
ncbi:MAG: VanZ family protein [Acidobacteriota bacterium]